MVIFFKKPRISVNFNFCCSLISVLQLKWLVFNVQDENSVKSRRCRGYGGGGGGVSSLWLELVLLMVAAQVGAVPPRAVSPPPPFMADLPLLL